MRIAVLPKARFAAAFRGWVVTLRVAWLVSRLIAMIYRPLGANLSADLPGFCALMGHICAPDSGDVKGSLQGVSHENRAEFG
jgi:hypothetical protein